MKPIISDKILRDAVVMELERDPEVAAHHIWVSAMNGAVTLGGHVRTDHEKHVAVRAAERVDAVRAVADDIEVRPPSLHERADDEIAEEIARLRSWRPQIPDSVAAEVRNGRVILHGQVESVSDRDAAEGAIRHLTGVHLVDNLIDVELRSEPAAADGDGPAKKGSAMQISKQSAVEALRRAGLSEAAEEAERSLPDPVELDDAQKFGFERFGITRDDLISRLGGSP